MGIEINEIMENRVIEYVYQNYPQFKDKTLTVKEIDNHFQISYNEDSSPLILGKNILKEFQ